MKTFLSIISILLLIVVALAALFVINDPAYAQRLAGMEEEITPPVRVQVADAQPAFDRRAAAQESRPPTREELEAQMEAERGAIEVQRFGRFVGPVTRDRVGALEPPPAQLYPFTINRRTFPDAASISVQIAIRNLSGKHWETAYVTFRAPRTEEAVLFQIDEWRIDEIVGLEYVFPRHELEARVRDLRVVAVSGKERESALSRRLSDSRRETVESTQTLGKRRRASGESLRAPGLLAVVASWQAPYTGIQITQGEMRQVQAQVIRVEIPEEEQLPLALGMNIRQTSEERQAVAELIQRYHELSLETQDILQEMAGELNGKPVTAALSQPSLSRVPEVQEKLKELHDLGTGLTRMSLRTKDSEVERVKEVVIGHAQKINLQVLRIEAAVQAADPSFRVRPRG